MALTTSILTNSASDLGRVQEEKKKPLKIAPAPMHLFTSKGCLADKQVVVSEEKSLPVAQKILNKQELEDIAFSSKSNNFRDSAFTLAVFALVAGVLGLINPLFFAAAVFLLLAAVMCGAESKTAAYEAEDAKSQLKPVYQEEAAIQADQDLEEVTPPQDAEIAKLLRGKTVTIEENGRFKPDEFDAMMKRNSDGSLKAFSSYNEAIAYPYTVPGVEKDQDESASDAIFRHFAKQAVIVQTPEFVQQMLNNKGTWIQNNARHICGFLKLLGDGNNPVNAHITERILMQNQGVALHPVALKAGKLTTLCKTGQIGDSPIMYTVKGDVVGLYSLEDFGLPQADRQPIARFETSRTVTVFPPDLAGNVRYTINRTFTRI